MTKTTLKAKGNINRKDPEVRIHPEKDPKVGVNDEIDLKWEDK